MLDSPMARIVQVPVDSVSTMEQVITQYVAQGFALVNKTATTATLQKKKEFNVLWAVIGFVLCLMPLLIYLIIYATKPDVEVVQIDVTGMPPVPMGGA